MAINIPRKEMGNKGRHGNSTKQQINRSVAYCQSSSMVLWLLLATIYFSNTTTSFTPLHTQQQPQHRITLQSSSSYMVQTSGSKGLSRYFQAILSRSTCDRQRFVTGKYPVIVSVKDNPTQKWLNKDSATSLILVNGTTIDRSLASYDRFQWMDDDEREELHDRYASISLELLAEVHMPKPGYVQTMSRLGAGASAEMVREYGSTTRWNRWQNSTLYKELFLDELVNQRRQLSSMGRKLPSKEERLWVTGFSLAGRKGLVRSFDVDSGHIGSVNSRSESMTLWPNEVTRVPSTLIAPKQGQQRHRSSKEKHDDHSRDFDEDALLVSDGFLVPGKDRGGIYIIKNPGNPLSEWTVSLTDREGESWFYHRAVWVDLTGDGRQSILTARAKLRKVASDARNHNPFTNGRFGGVKDEDMRPKNGQLVWLEMPEPHHYDPATGTPLEEDGTEFDPFCARHLPWKEHVLARGPDVMFSVADMDTTDDTVEVISSQFFDRKVTLHSIKCGPKPRVTFSRVIDNRCGAAFGAILADLREKSSISGTSTVVVVDSGSTIESLQPGDSFSHVLVTSHECNYAESTNIRGPALSLHGHLSKLQIHSSHHPHGMNDADDGGSLFTYKVPQGPNAWKTEPWIRTTVASGFKVNGQLWNVINPGAPGFVYTFHATSNDRANGKRPLIAVAGDCAESAYLFRPEKLTDDGDDPASGGVVMDKDARYKLMCEIQCGATVGSIAVGYDNLCSVEQEAGYAKLYIPCFEKDKILVFALGSGEDTIQDEGSFETEWHRAKSLLV